MRGINGYDEGGNWLFVKMPIESLLVLSTAARVNASDDAHSRNVIETCGFSSGMRQFGAPATRGRQ